VLHEVEGEFSEIAKYDEFGGGWTVHETAFNQVCAAKMTADEFINKND